MSRRERLLMFGFAGALVVFGVIFVFTIGGAWTRQLFSESDRLRERVNELEQLIESRDSWQEQDAWLDENVPGFSSRQEASTALLDAVDSLEQGDVTLSSRELTEPAGAEDEEEDNAYFEATAVRIAVQASEADLYRWIHQMHDPQSFRGITSLAIERGESGALRAEIELTQFFLP